MSKAIVKKLMAKQYSRPPLYKKGYRFIGGMTDSVYECLSDFDTHERYVPTKILIDRRSFQARRHIKNPQFLSTTIEKSVPYEG